MIENELKKIWQGSPQTEIVKFEKSKVLIDLNHRLSKMDRTIKNRDIVETIAAITVFGVFIYYAFIIPSIFSKIGSCFISIWALFVIYKLRNARMYKGSQDLSLPIYQLLLQSKKHFEKEMQLNNSVLYWYIIPPFIGSILFFMGMNLEVKRQIFMLLIMTILSIGVFILNKNTVKKNFKPLLKDIEEAIDEFGEE